MTTLLTHKKATFNFEILDTFSAGVELFGTEVKSLRKSLGKLDGSFVIVRGGEAFLVNAQIPLYQLSGAPKEYNSERPRRLLLKNKEIAEIEQKTETEGLTCVPLRWYTNGRHIKLEIGIAKGKKNYDKRESIKERESKRNLARLMK